MSKNDYAVIGKPQTKVDGLELVTGAAKFSGDMRLPGMLYGYAVRAGVPAGILKSVDVSAALTRITSYNVCYTKLLRFDVFQVVLARVMNADRVVCAESGDLCAWCRRFPGGRLILA